MKSWTAALILLGAVCIVGVSKPAEAQLRWPDSPKKTPMRIRLVAVALADRRSSFFSSHEVFVAETEIEHDEWRLIKLVFTYLPYQPGLLDAGFDYSVIHEVSAHRVQDCDETVEQLTARNLPDRHEPLIYARHVPREDLDRRRIPLPCYETTADEYIRTNLEPIAPALAPTPSLKERSNAQPIPFLEQRSNPTPIPFIGKQSNAQAAPVSGSTSNPKPLPPLGQRLNAKPIPFLDEASNARPVPFLQERANTKPVPILGRPKPKPIPFMEGSSNAKPIPFLDESLEPRPIPTLDEAPKPKPIPFLNEPPKP